ncbi:hypothetical protein LNL84_11220 [Vibrio sp. ZSDZ34]|uniref:Uncharacterized protein n=1 Tax=Vibrio gelatinilyticus TaxID=2893468 RepID=A0A9X1WFE3_9VIBR|nr:hypothetical protein [Vibrio gelatinilyticus]MCJ2377400.1 hypothetical protein [Vibrio gelatinilyticus]
MYGSEKTKAFCCNCKEVTLHKYESFSQPQKSSESKATGFFASIANALMGGEAKGDYKCEVCGTNLHTPDNLD